MQNLGRRYVQYFNYTHGRSGTLWEGRFKSCLVQDSLYLLHVYRYIELNPVRAEMVVDPAHYPWSSYQVNALGGNSNLCTPHALYNQLGKTNEERLVSYRGMFKHQQSTELLTDIHDSVVKGLALGNDRFKKEIEALSGRRVTEGKKGRSIGWRKIKRI